MKRKKWKKHHKWFGLLFAFFMLMFCVSGIVLNHRSTFADINVSRKWLPDAYHFDRWNNGLLRGTLRYAPTPGDTSIVLVYGTGGVWKTTSKPQTYVSFNNGLPEGADFRTVRGLVQMPDGKLFAAAQFGLYVRKGKAWALVTIPLVEGERITDLTAHGDTLVVLGRSALYVSTAPYSSFTKILLKAPDGYEGKVSLFRTVWMLHCGEMFGLGGKLLMDGVALILIFLCVSGLVYWVLPKIMRRFYAKGQAPHLQKTTLKYALRWHDKVGRYTIVILLFVAFTGWCLRPPVLLALAAGKVTPIPGTSLASNNAWNDKLRMLRYDESAGDWLISTADGFFSMKHFSDVPKRLNHQPPVSVMGLNVFEKDNQNCWLCGSFSGLFVWNRSRSTVHDYFTGEPYSGSPGSPFGKHALSGYTADLTDKPCFVDYYEGTGLLHMPASFECLPMSLWNLSLEVHTGRIYTFLGPITLVFITFAGLIALWCLWTGYKVRLNPKKKK